MKVSFIISIFLLFFTCKAIPQTSPSKDSYGHITDQKGRFYGSGFVLEDSNIVVTARHVIDSALINGKKMMFWPQSTKDSFNLTFLDTLPPHDIAVFRSYRKITNDFLLLAKDKLQSGDTITYFGFDSTATNKRIPTIFPYQTTILQFISRYNRPVTDLFEFFAEHQDMWKNNEKDLHFDAQPGCSGGPILNNNGNVIGILVEASMNKEVNAKNFSLVLVGCTSDPLHRFLKKHSR